MFAMNEQRWIPVSERLPDDGEAVLLYYGGEIDPIEVGKYLGLGGVTHWMPLPDPPSDATSDSSTSTR